LHQVRNLFINIHLVIIHQLPPLEGFSKKLLSIIEKKNALRRGREELTA
jgi:hypothetical protein